MKSRRQRATVWWNGVEHDMDIAVVRLALVRRQVEGKFHTMEQLAEAAGHSRSTVSRWFAGHPTSLAVALAILVKLELRFDDVYRRCPAEPVEPGSP